MVLWQHATPINYIDSWVNTIQFSSVYLYSSNSQHTSCQSIQKTKVNSIESYRLISKKVHFPFNQTLQSSSVTYSNWLKCFCVSVKKSSKDFLAQKIITFLLMVYWPSLWPVITIICNHRNHRMPQDVIFGKHLHSL